MPQVGVRRGQAKARSVVVMLLLLCVRALFDDAPDVLQPCSCGLARAYSSHRPLKKTYDSFESNLQPQPSPPSGHESPLRQFPLCPFKIFVAMCAPDPWQHC